MKEKDLLALIEAGLNNNAYKVKEIAQAIAHQESMLGLKPDFANQIKQLVLKHTEISVSDPIENRENPKFILNQELKNHLQILKTNLKINPPFINKILCSGAPGTGKTKFAKELARILNWPIKIVNYSEIIDSKLGATNKNLERLFQEYNRSQTILFFDELDGISTKRTNQKDLYEMARLTTTLLKCLDNLNPQTIFIGATNLVKMLDQALLRRIDYHINFDTYTKTDLITIATNYCKHFQIGDCPEQLSLMINNPNVIMTPAVIETLCKQIKMYQNANLDPKPIYQKFLAKFNQDNDLKDQVWNKDFC